MDLPQAHLWQIIWPEMNVQLQKCCSLSDKSPQPVILAVRLLTIVDVKEKSATFCPQWTDTVLQGLMSAFINSKPSLFVYNISS